MSCINSLRLIAMVGFLACAGWACGVIVAGDANGRDEQDEAKANSRDAKIGARSEDFREAGEILVHYKAERHVDAIREAERAGLEILEDYRPGRFLRCVPALGIAAANVAGAAHEVAQARNDAVAWVEPNSVLSIPVPPGPARQTIPIAMAGTAVAAAAPVPKKPDDPELYRLWGMTNIHAREAWSTGVEDPPIIVAVIDTGVDYNHPDLHANMWRNPNEQANGKDDDGNNIADDIFGANFHKSKGSGNPMDDNGHGTHCAGIIGAVGNNHLGVAGVDWTKVRIMALKYLRANGKGFIDDAVRCIDYAIDHNAKVLSCSWAGPTYSQALKDAIGRAEQKNALVIVAAGNDKADLENTPAYPASYDNKNILSVASINPKDELSEFSNFGAKSVDLAAPGGTGSPYDDDDIYSTLPAKNYGYLAGTSMAAPHVSGAAALIWAHPENKGATADKVRDLIMKEHARKLASLKGKCVSEATLDIEFLGPKAGAGRQ